MMESSPLEALQITLGGSSDQEDATDESYIEPRSFVCRLDSVLWCHITGLSDWSCGHLLESLRLPAVQELNMSYCAADAEDVA